MQLRELAEQAFISKGFTNWKDATKLYTKHEASDFDRRCIDSLKSHADVGEMLSSEYQQQRREHRDYLVQVVSSIRFLARQGIPLRGDNNESDSNFMNY